MPGSWKADIPNLVTFSRILFVPAIIAVLLENTTERSIWAAALFAAASITDYFDGYLARKFNVESNLGKFVDPVADKILVMSTLIMMIPTRGISPILVILLLSRDTLVEGIRAVAAASNLIISAGQLGKWKTLIQMFCIPAALIENDVLGLPTKTIGIAGLWISVVLSMISGFQYVRMFFLKAPIR
ncbi:MAG: CDP-diacylglycerol--glycerol-3-phosphate 3-phosphatidyltransferase [Bdellovibrionia bacterium]